MTLTLDDLKEKHNLYRYEKNPALLKDVKLDRDLIESKDSLSVLYTYFIDCIEALQKNDFVLEEKVSNKLLNADYSEVCKMGSIAGKAECAIRLKSMEDAILSYLIYQNFQQNLLEKTCELYYYKSVSTWEDYCAFGRSIGVSFCASDESVIKFCCAHWSDPPSFIMYKIVIYECPIWPGNKIPLNKFAQGMISNNVLEMPASEMIQNYFSTKIYQKLNNDSAIEEAQIEMIKFLKDFRKDAKLQSNKNYSYYTQTRQIRGIDFSLYTSMPMSGILTKKQQRRFDNKKSISTKKEIIKQFKSTEYYKMIKRGTYQ